MKIAWVTRSFLDYRIPVFEELDKLCNHQLYLFYSTVITPERVHNKAKKILKERCFGLGGEKCIGDSDVVYNHLANQTITIPLQFNLRKYIKKVRPDVIVCDGFFQWTFYAIIYHILFRVPVVMCYERTEHTEKNCQWYRRWYRKFSSFFFKRICCNGKLSLEYTHKSLGVPMKKLSCGHMAADVHYMEHFFNNRMRSAETVRKEFGNYDVLLLFVGRMIPRKGVFQLLSAFEKYQKISSESVGLILLGDGPELEKYRKMNIQNVFLPGAFPYEKVPEFYSAVDVFIMPTLEDNWSLVIPEAMACGLPVATSIYNGCWPELATPENGWVFDPLNEEDFVATIKKIVAAKNDFKKMGECSRKIIRDGHTPEHAAKAVFDAVQACFK